VNTGEPVNVVAVEWSWRINEVRLGVRPHGRFVRAEIGRSHAAGPGNPVSLAGPRSTMGVCSRCVNAQRVISSLRANQTSFFCRM
jgi:hypothetical protein